MKHISPRQSWDLLQATPHTILIDIRMEIESLYVGRPPHAINIPWYEFPDFEADSAAFVHAVSREVTSKDQTVVLICRTGSRTLDAGEALVRAGFTNIVNIVNGFEGDLDADDHRSTVNGWRFEGLPWEQM